MTPTASRNQYPLWASTDVGVLMQGRDDIGCERWQGGSSCESRLLGRGEMDHLC
jgi:hypothetical protein